MDELAGANPPLELKNLSVGYKGNAIVSGINATLQRGKLVSLIGSNGIGKSTLLKTVTRELAPVEGEILLFNKPLKDYTRKQLARSMAIVTTERIDAGGLRVEELVALGRHPHTGISGRLTAADHKIVEESMVAVNICYKRDFYVACLSDGERQRAMIAKALAQEAPLLVLDEPLSFLDTSSRIEVFDLLNNMAQERNIGILLSCHDVAQSLRMSSEIWLIDRDHNFIAAPPAEIIKTKAIERMFNSRKAVFDPALSDFVISSH